VPAAVRAPLTILKLVTFSRLVFATPLTAQGRLAVMLPRGGGGWPGGGGRCAAYQPERQGKHPERRLTLLALACTWPALRR
jgi:hypothetical protein